MGLLDQIFPASDGGGLLDYLRQNTAALQPSPGFGDQPANFADRFNAIPNAPQPPSGRQFDQATFDPATYAPSPNMPSWLTSAMQSPPTQPSQQPAMAQASPPQGVPQSAMDAAAAPLNQPQAGPIGVGNYQMPRVGAADLFQPQTPTDVSARARMGAPQGQVPSQVAPPQAAPQASPGVGDRLMAGYQAIHGGGGLVGGLIGAMTGQRIDDKGIAEQQQAQVANLTARALINKGVDPEVAIAAVQPGNGEALKELFKTTLMSGTHAQETDKDGNVWDVNKQTGQRTVALQSKDDKFQHVQTGENGLGQKSFGIFNTKTGETKPDAGAPTDGAAPPLGDMNKTGAEYISTLPRERQGIVRGMLDGTIQPPTSFAASKPYWQTMLAAAKQADPKFDENTWSARHKMSVDLASSGNSSMGGILSNGESSFKHLAEYTKSAAEQGNASHDFPLGGVIAHGQNYVGNSLGGSDTNAKIKAINDNLGHYGQESTKFYAGTGGGVEERMNALKEMNPTTVSGEEAAAYAEKEKGLMLDRLNQKLAQIKDTFGEEQGNAIIAKHMPEIQRSVAVIDGNIAKLRGKAAADTTVKPLDVGQSTSIGNVTIKKVSN